jgi:hypothetical protein
MMATGPGTGSPAPASPGGTAKLGGRAVARIGFGAMQLEQQAVGHGAAVAILRQAADAASTTSIPHSSMARPTP